jgi:Holliday junction resolvasome RuvABC endonuclease subunit
MSELKKLLALDQSSSVSGYAIFDTDGSLISYGKIAPEGETVDRIMKLVSEVKKLISENDIEEVVIEDIYYSGNAETYKVLSFVMAGLIFLFTEEEIPYNILTASQWKSQLNIKGKNRPEQKRKAQEYIEKEYDLKVIQDVCDSICIGATHIKKKYNKDAHKSKECHSEEKELLYF